MLKKEMVAGKFYAANDDGHTIVVRLNVIENGRCYRVTSMKTGRERVFKSALKFLREVPEPTPVLAVEPAPLAVGDSAVEIEEVVYGSRPETTESDNGFDAMAAKLSPEGQKQVDEFLANIGEEREAPKPAPAPSRLTATLAARKPMAMGPAHLVIEARAGTGKTTTLVEGLKRVKGIASPMVPSPQQAAVWAAMEESRGKVSSICFTAFNRDIVAELRNKVPAGCDAKTFHGLGFGSVKKSFRLLPGDGAVNAYRVRDLILPELTGLDIDVLRREKTAVVSAVAELVSYCKSNLIGSSWEEGSSQWTAALDQLVDYYEMDLEDRNRSEVFDLVPRVLARCKDVNKDGCIDFDDQVWLPVVMNLPVFRFDLLLVDEAQDLNRSRQALAKMAGRRLILCGDPKQAIYGFAGADCESMDRMERELADTPNGCQKLFLTVTRRCGKAIVREAQALVPDFHAHETTGEGEIKRAKYPYPPSETRKEVKWEDSYGPMADDGDMVLCRVNAPLVSQCFRFLKAGKKANIQGRKIGEGLITLIKKLKASSVDELGTKLTAWGEKEVAKENAKRNPSEAKIIAVYDRVDCILCFSETAEAVEDVIAKINSIFTDTPGRGIRLSSIHKAKGLEANRVFLLEPDRATVPHPMAKGAWQLEQEYNLRYVAITRAKTVLVYVS